MSHEIELREYPEDVNKKDVYAELNSYVEEATWEEGVSGLYDDIEWVNKVFKTREEAEQYLEDDSHGDYAQIAAKFRERKISKVTKELQSVREKLKKSRENLSKTELDSVSNLKNAKSKFIGCKKCGSSLNRKELSSSRCPLCYSELRSKTVLDNINNKRKKINKLVKSESEIEEKLKKMGK